MSSPSESTYEEKDENKQNQADAQLQANEPTEMSEIFALQQFYFQTLGRGWHRQEGWNTNRRAGDIHEDMHLRGWSGVTIERRGKTTEIRLSDNNLSGPTSSTRLAVLGWDLPRWWLLKSLKFLTVLDLSRNRLKGYIPHVLAQLEFLEDLNLDSNRFCGEIPSGLGQLHRLKYLRLGNNRLRGTIPRELGQLFYLRLLSLSQNRLTGHIPEEVKNLQDLQHLDCWDNEFSDLIEAWACMITVPTGDRHVFPLRMYVFFMDASPKSLVRGSASAREAEAESRAEGWMLWYLDKQQNGGQANASPPSRLCQTQVRMVTLPQSKRAKVFFAVTTREGETRVVSCRILNVAVPVVFGSVNANGGAARELKLEDFPHHVVPMIDEQLIRLFDDQSPLPLSVTDDTRASPASHTFFLEGDELFAGRWEAYMRRRYRSFFGFRFDMYICASPMFACISYIYFGASFFLIYILLFFTLNLVAAHPVPVFWASLAVWSAVFLYDLAAQCLRRRSLYALPGLVCRALLYGGIFWLTNIPIGATFMVIGVYWLFITPMLFVFLVNRVRACVTFPSLQLKIRLHQG